MPIVKTNVVPEENVRPWLSIDKYNIKFVESKIAVAGLTLKLLLIVEVLKEIWVPEGKFRVIVSVWAIVSGITNENLKRYCLFTVIIEELELVIEIVVINFGDKFVT